MCRPGQCSNSPYEWCSTPAPSVYGWKNQFAAIMLSTVLSPQPGTLTRDRTDLCWRVSGVRWSARSSARVSSRRLACNSPMDATYKDSR